jgi:hypothetical protein
MWEKCGRPGQDTHGSTVHALSMLDCYTNAPPYYVVRTVGIHCLSCSVGGSNYNRRNMSQMARQSLRCFSGGKLVFNGNNVA